MKSHQKKKKLFKENKISRKLNLLRLRSSKKIMNFNPKLIRKKMKEKDSFKNKVI